MKIGDIVKNYRLEHSLSLRQFGEMAGFSHSYVKMLEAGINTTTNAPLEPSFKAYKGVANAMGMDVNELIKMVDGDSVVALCDEEYNTTQPSELSADEQHLLRMFRTLTPDAQQIAIKTMESFAGNPAMQKESTVKSAM